jgi:FG-GAP-like repeat
MSVLRHLTDMHRFVQITCFAFALVWNVPNADAGITFTPGHIYSTSTFGNTTNVMEYSAGGAFLGSLTIPSLLQDDELRGIAFGPDGLLYAVMVHFGDSGYQVLALDSSGRVHQTYRMNGIRVWASGSSGKIAIDDQGNMYVAGGDALVHFRISNPNSGRILYHQAQAEDVEILPTGHLFVAWEYGINEITSTGAFVRTVVSATGTDFANIWGIEYNPATNKLFVTQLGTTASIYSILRLNASTGEIETGSLFQYASDLFLTGSGDLIVGSWTQKARIYSQDMTSLGPLGTEQRFFVTQFPVNGSTPTGPPIVTTSPATNVANFSATLNGTVNPNGLYTAVRFEYGFTSNYGSSTATQNYSGGTVTVHNVIANLSSLRAGATYHFRIVASNIAGTTYGADRTFSTPAARAVVADFNGDAAPDLVVRRTNSHQTGVLYLNGNVVIGAAVGPTLPAGWSLAAAADFDGDGKADYALFNSATGQTAIVYLSDVTVVGAAAGPSLSAGWELVAATDFNGDGHPDYVLYKPSTHETAIWHLNNNVFVNATSGPTLPNGWNLAAVADLNGDGFSDYALFNSITGQTVIGYLSGGMIVGAAFGPTLPGPWPIVATADFSQDGHADYLLFSPSTRQTAVGYLDNNVLVGAALGPTLPSGWTLAVP